MSLASFTTGSAWQGISVGVSSSSAFPTDTRGQRTTPTVDALQEDLGNPGLGAATSSPTDDGYAARSSSLQETGQAAAGHGPPLTPLAWSTGEMHLRADFQDTRPTNDQAGTAFCSS